MANSRWVSSQGRLSFTYNNNNPSNGQVRWAEYGGGFEVFDGYNWRLLGHWGDQQFTDEFEKAMQWVSERMRRDQELQALASANPAVQIALENVETAQRQLDTVVALTRTDNF